MHCSLGNFVFETAFITSIAFEIYMSLFGPCQKKKMDNLLLLSSVFAFVVSPASSASSKKKTSWYLNQIYDVINCEIRYPHSWGRN